jgi:hypothetical protein
MPRKKKHAQDMTTDEALRHVLGVKGANHAKRLANPPDEGEGPKLKAQVKSTKKKHKG